VDGLGENWVWEYEFSPNGRVTWRDTRSLENGNGKWSLTPKLVNIAWFDSGTKESWQRPLNEMKNNRTWYSSSYYTGAYLVEKIQPKPFELPKTQQPDDTIDIEYGPQFQSNYIDNLCTHVAYGIYNGGFWVYVPALRYPIEVPENLLWFTNTGTPVTDEIYSDQASAIQRVGGVNPNHIAYYEGAGGNILCPTAFTYKTAPTIVNTASIVVDELIAEVTEELKDIMVTLVLSVCITTVGAIAGRAAEVRRLKARDARAKAALENARLARTVRPVGPIRGKDVTEEMIRNGVVTALAAC